VIEIREEIQRDRDAVFEVNRAAFEREDEARMVDALRDSGAAIVSLVAVDGGRVAGHILFTSLPIETPDRTIRGAALAPVAVLPGRQREGIGSMLIRRGLEQCRARNVVAAAVLGHMNYYPRFGFSPALARNLLSPFSGDEFMAIELTPGVLGGASGRVRYARAFGLDAEFTQA
jgi:putative acetyltransferase